MEVRGSNLNSKMLAALRSEGTECIPEKIYSIAAVTFTGDDLAKKVGRIQAQRGGPMLRDLTVNYLRSHGFSSVHS